MEEDVREHVDREGLTAAAARIRASSHLGRSETLRRLFDFLLERTLAGEPPKEIVATLPKDPRQMFGPGFPEAVEGRGSHWLADSFAANSVHDMTQKAPVRMYYGSEDVDVIPDESRLTAAAMRARAADVTAVDVGPLGHDPSMLAAAPRILDWLRELEAARR